MRSNREAQSGDPFQPAERLDDLAQRARGMNRRANLVERRCCGLGIAHVPGGAASVLPRSTSPALQTAWGHKEGQPAIAGAPISRSAGAAASTKNQACFSATCGFRFCFPVTFAAFIDLMRATAA